MKEKFRDLGSLVFKKLFKYIMIRCKKFVIRIVYVKYIYVLIE